MPIYEYRCSDCGHEFELLVGVNQENIACPACEGADCKRILSVFGFASGGKFTSSKGSACAGCSGGDCKGCK